MSLLRNKSIEQKIKFVNMAISLMSVLLVCAGFLIYEIFSTRQRMISDLSTKAQIIGANSTAALAFDNKNDALEVLNALRSQPRIVSATIFDSHKNFFVSYSRGEQEIPLSTFPADTGAWFENSSLKLLQPIILNHDIVGTIYIESDLETMYNRMRSYAGIALLVLLSSMGIAFVIGSRLQKRITQPILEVAATARKVSELNDYSIRAVRSSDDEIGALAETINQMLSRIEERDASLQNANEAMTLEIRERKHAEDVLRSSEERFRHLFETHPLPMWVYDIETLYFLEVNQSAIRQYGYSQEEFLSMRITEIRPAEDIPRLVDNLKQERPVLEFSSGWKHRLKDGRIIQVEIVSHQTEYLNRKAVLVVALDVTERKRAEEELKISEERYRSLVSALTSIVWTVDPDGRFIIPQKSWEKYTGQRWEEHAGFGWINAFHEGDRERILKTWEHSREQKTLFVVQGKIWNNETRSYRYFIARGVPLVNSDDTIREWIGTVTDVHDQRVAEEEVRILNTQLERRVAERTLQLEEANKELEAFSYSVSHDLRAPLRHIDGFIGLLSKKISDTLDEKGKRYLDFISGSAKEMGTLIDELLIFSRMGRTEMRFSSMNMDEIVKIVINDIEHDLNGRTVHWNIQPLPSLQADPSMMKQVWTNLISNAIKYTGKRDVTEISIGVQSGDDHETVFYVKDNGVGFEMQYAHKLFGVFSRLHSDKDFEGVGIGLANVRRIVQRHGGKTWAEGAVDKGATFYFTLPHNVKKG